MINRIKLTLSVLANNFSSNMYLHQYAQFVLKHKKYDYKNNSFDHKNNSFDHNNNIFDPKNTLDNYVKAYANSGFLKSIIHSNKMGLTTAHEYLNKSFLKQVKL